MNLYLIIIHVAFKVLVLVGCSDLRTKVVPNKLIIHL